MEKRKIRTICTIDGSLWHIDKEDRFATIDSILRSDFISFKSEQGIVFVPIGSIAYALLEEGEPE